MGGSRDWEKDGIYDLVIDGYMMDNMMGSGMGNGGYGMGPGMGYGGYGMGSGNGMGPGYGMGSGSGMGSGEGMGSGQGMGSGEGSGMGGGYGMGMGSGMGMGYGGMGMGMNMDDMDWPERCRRHCIYKKRDSYDDRMYCFARSSYSQSMCMRDDYDGEKPINVDGDYEYSGYGSGNGMGGSGSGMGGHGSGSGMGGHGSGSGMGDHGSMGPSTS